MFELLADAGVFTHSASGGMDKDSQALGSMFVEYIDLTRALLESESDKDSDSLRDIRAHFSALLANILQNVRVEHRRNLFPQQSLRHSLFLLFSQWAGPFSVMFTPLDRYSDRHHQINRHQYSALKAMAAVLCCGPVFDNVGLSSDGYLYKWLDNILACHDARVHQLGSETVGLLLELNPDQGNLLNWVVDRCYTGSQRVSAGCFHAFTAAFTSRDYVVDPVTLLCLILFMISGHTARYLRDCNAAVAGSFQSSKSHFICSLFVPLCLVYSFLTAHRPYSILPQLCEAKLFHYAQKMECRRGESQPLNLHTPLAHLYAASGLQLSEELAHAYPELTLSVFSEVSQRFPTAHPSGRQAMLAFLVPWLYNVELVDGRPPPAPPASYQAGPGTPESGSDCGIRPPEVCDTGQGYIRMASGSWHDETQGGRWLHGSGWGSVHASTFLLNNLMYITAKYGDDMVGGEMEAVWTTLANSWCHNQHVILQFLIALCGVRSDPLLLPYLKKVVIYLARDKPVQLLETFLAELQLTESVNSVLVHTDNPPYYRIAGMHKTPSIASGTTSSSNTIVPDGGDGMREVRRGKMHKESSFEDGTYLMADLYFGFNSSSIRPQHPRLESRYSNSSGGSYDEEKGDLVPPYVCWRMRLLESHRPESLPMPVSGGCWAPLIDYLPEVLSSGTPLHRSNVVVILMTDLVVDHGVGVDWASSLPLLLHAIILGLDHYRPEVYTHCRRLLLHLLLVLACPQSRVPISVALIRQRHVSEGRALRGPPSPATRDPLTASSHRFSDSQGSDSRLSIGSSCSTGAVPIAGPAAGSGGPSLPALSSSMAPNDGEERSKEFIDFLISRKSGPLWSHEDIGPKHSTIRSAEQLGWFVCRLVDVFQHANPGLPLDQQLAHVALHTALSCSSRHYAARAFQTFRALRQPLGSIALSDLLARLVETVGDPSDETQGYVMEMMLTLEASVITIMESSKQADFLSALSRSTSPDPSVLHLKCAMNRRSTGHLSLAPAGGVSTLVGWFPFTSGHHRSNSVPKHVRTADRFADAPRRSATLDRLEARSANAQRPMALSCSLGKARSLGSLKEGQADSWAGAPAIGTGHSSNASGGSPGGSSDPTGLLVTIFWAAVALLESDYESEYSVALRLLDRLLSNGEIMPAGESSRLTLDRPAGLEKLEKVLTQLGWSGFPGVQALLLKGFTSAATLERTIHLLQKLTHVSRAPVFDMTQSTGFPLNVLCLLPHLVQNFDNPSDFCRRCADCIAQVCVAEKTTKLANLAHVMSLYRNGSYTRDSANWVSVVCRYLHDSFADRTFTLITYIAELLDKGLAILQPTLLQILLSLLSYADLLTVPAASFNQKVMKVIGKYVQSLQWREALNILKLVVSRSASLASPLETRASLALEPSVPLELSVHRVWNAGVKALPGKTLEFHFDVSETPVIGRKYAEQQGPVGHDGKPKAIAVTRSTSSTSSGSGSNALVPVSWKKPQLSQRRTREKLANVLSLCGQEVGLSKNPSVIFSSSGELELVETPPLGPSGEDVGGGDEAHEDTLSEQHFGVFKDFDFLDVELEEAEGESVDNFNWGVRRRSLDSLDKEGLPSLQECDFVCTTQGLDLNHPADTDESSDEELTTYSPTEESVLSQIEVAACEHLPNGLGTPASGTPAVGTPAGDSPSVDISLSEEHSVWEVLFVSSISKLHYFIKQSDFFLYLTINLQQNGFFFNAE
uniref:Protein furry n=1 Tax=Eptatretus burgeri TaxID=7764 RepID=A0A8C4N6G3_EPTBU